jgi:hypothetical protein
MTFLATAPSHAAVRRRYSVHFERDDRLLKRLRASWLDNSHDTEMRKLLWVDLLIVDACARCSGWRASQVQRCHGFHDEHQHADDGGDVIDSAGEVCRHQHRHQGE